MSKKSSATPANHTHDAQKLADLAALLGLMQAAGKLSQELEALATRVGGSLETMAERFGVPFFEVHQAYIEEQNKPKPKKTRKATVQR